MHLTSPATPRAWEPQGYSKIRTDALTTALVFLSAAGPLQGRPGGRGGLELGLQGRWIAEVSWSGPLPSRGTSLLTHVDLLILLARVWRGTGVEDLTEAAGGAGAETCE